MQDRSNSSEIYFGKKEGNREKTLNVNNSSLLSGRERNETVPTNKQDKRSKSESSPVG